MMRRNIIQRTFLEGTLILRTPAVKFHVTPKNLVRSAFRKNLPNDIEKHTESMNDPLISMKSNANFYGIESEEGVITTGSKGNIEQKNIVKKKLMERFHRASFGVIRYDSDNKPQYHGQFRKACDVFPHNSNEYSEVSENLTKVTSNHYKSYNDLEINKLDSSVFSSKTRDDTICSNDILNKESSDHNYSMKDNQNTNYVDQFYFNTHNEICNDFEVNKLHSTMTSKIVEGDSIYRNGMLKRESCDHSDSVKENISYIDEYYFNSCKEKEQSVENNSDHLSISEDLNFIDQNYFGDLTVSENKKKYQDQNISENTVLVQEANAAYTNEFYLGNLKFDNIEDKKLNSLPNNPESSQKYEKGENIQDAFCSQANTSDKEYENNINSSNTSDKEYENNINSSKNTIRKEFISNNGINMTSYADSLNIKNNLSMKENNFKLKRSTVKLDEPSSDGVEHDYDPQTAKPLVSVKDSKHSNIFSEGSNSVDNITTAYDFVQDLRKQKNIPQSNVKIGSGSLDTTFDSKGFRILKNQVDDLSNFTQDEIFNLLKESILYSDDNLMILNKPYNLVMHESKTTKSPCLSAFLDKLANEMNQQKDEDDLKLHTVHRLDKETTGCVLLARTEMMAQHLKSLFAQRKIIKKYWILTSRVPDPPEGVIDIPIAEGSVNNKKRMVLHPEIPKDISYKNHSRRGKQAVTSYKVLSESGNAALVEATPLTGIKHQIRVHFGFGLCCPILGDHKYSHLDKLAPQKLPSDILQRLHVRQSKVRYIPLHIHAKSVTIPGYFEGRDLYVKAPLPNHMKENLKRLKFKK